MRRPRHRPVSSGRLSIALLSALALVVFACLPALAQAEDCTDSSCKQYEVEIPTAGGKEKPGNQATEGSKEPKANASESPPAGQGKTQPSEGGNSEEEKNGAAAGGNGGPTDKGNSAGGGNNGSNPTSTGIEDEKALGTAQGQNASHSDGGSSPLVPILIAIAVLAAISIGAVIYRQRRQGSGGTGSPVSPNA